MLYSYVDLTRTHSNQLEDKSMPPVPSMSDIGRHGHLI